MLEKSGLGERIKQFRLSRNLTLKEVEQKAKVSATHVSEIERGLTSPTVGSLTKIAHALGTEPGYFLQTGDYPGVSVVRSDRRRVLRDGAWGGMINRLCSGICDVEMSFLEIELDPGLEQSPEPITHTGEEFLFVRKGVVEAYVGLDRFLLKEGDSLHFKSNEPHTLRNIGDGKARVIWTLVPALRL